MKHKYVPTELLQEKWKNITSKGGSRNLIEDIIYQLNKLKEPLSLANQEKWLNPKDEEKNKAVKKLLSKKALFLKQLISLSFKYPELVLVIEWSLHLKKLNLIFRLDKKVIHISHLHPIGIIYTSPNYETAKLMTSYVNDYKWKNICYEKIKEKYNK